MANSAAAMRTRISPIVESGAPRVRSRPGDVVRRQRRLVCHRPRSVDTNCCLRVSDLNVGTPSHTCLMATVPPLPEYARRHCSSYWLYSLIPPRKTKPAKSFGVTTGRKRILALARVGEPGCNRQNCSECAQETQESLREVSTSAIQHLAEQSIVRIAPARAANVIPLDAAR